MQTHDYTAIKSHPLYKEIRDTRKRLVWPLSVVILVAYLAFILSLAFYPASLGKPIEGGVTSIGILFGFGLIILTFLLTGIYSYVANRTIEPLLEKLRAEFTTDHKAE